ncbi:MAG: DNA mismatch repair protein MutS [Hyphomicrobiaceae bacterium]|nr:DNA mismatch repair protein MutS [Hyphomicrobiaceae bacterium]
MAQFLEIKTANPDCILWYRMGDFYELFFEDAVIASEALGIVLTKRGKHLGEDIPMCGVPVHRADEYLQRLIRRGFRVAVCEQLEDPAEARKRGSKAVVRRDVVRLVTPGTLTEESLLDARARNYLTALFRGPRLPDGPAGTLAATIALASVDISTGEFEVGLTGEADLMGELVRLAPQELLVADAAASDAIVSSALKASGAALTPVAGAYFDSLAGARLLKERLGVTELGGFGDFSRAELAAVGAVLRYVDLTQIGARPAIRPPRRTGPANTLVIDAASRSSLELLRATSGGRDGSLLSALDRTVTGAGARELAARIASPVTDLRAINARLDALGFLLDDSRLRDDVRGALRSAPDVARAVGRILLARGSPRDLAQVRDGLAAGGLIVRLLDGAAGAVGLPDLLASVKLRLAAVDPGLGERLKAALVDEPGHQKRDGGFVREGYRADLDDALRLRDDSRRVMAALEARYVEATGIKTLKVRHNNILGFYIETSAQNARPLLSPPHSDLFRHRQTMANAVRFTTPELEETEGRIASAAERALAIELEVYTELETAIRSGQQALGALAGALAELDCLAGLAETAEREGYVRPDLDSSTTFEIRGGRHPVVEQALATQKVGPFVENDCVLGRPQPLPEHAVIGGRPPGFDDTAEGRIWLVTGPNMAGKSTFLRQNALIVVMAQMGSFVPARAARIGLVDRLFSRVGAADDLARGRSTFMVEMVETAGILNQATERSLVILDEIGRGTATFDGLSIAWATVEHLHEVNRCRALFATHYHELTALAGRLVEVANATIDVKEWQDEIVFLHKVKKGAADRSYGIQVAKLAGLPKAVIDRAGEVLAVLEKSETRAKVRGRAVSVGGLEELPLFAAARPKSVLAGKAEPSEVEKALAAINPDELTPKAALDALYKLKAIGRAQS